MNMCLLNANGYIFLIDQLYHCKVFIIRLVTFFYLGILYIFSITLCSFQVDSIVVGQSYTLQSALSPLMFPASNDLNLQILYV